MSDAKSSSGGGCAEPMLSFWYGAGAIFTGISIWEIGISFWHKILISIFWPFMLIDTAVDAAIRIANSLL